MHHVSVKRRQRERQRQRKRACDGGAGRLAPGGSRRAALAGRLSPGGSRRAAWLEFYCTVKRRERERERERQRQRKRACGGGGGPLDVTHAMRRPGAAASA